MGYCDEFGEECNDEVPGVPWEETLYGSDFVKVASEYSGDWNWFVTNVWYSPSRGKYFRGLDAGCSCRAPWDRNVPISEFQVGSKEEVTKRLPQKLKIEVRDFDPTKVVDER